MKGLLCKSIALLLMLLLLLPPVLALADGSLSLTLPTGKGEDYLVSVEGQECIALPVVLSGSMLNNSCYIISGQFTLRYPSDKLSYVGSSQELKDSYGCYYESDGRHNQPWLIGSKDGELTLALASAYPCKVDATLITLYFRPESKTGSMEFNLSKGEFHFADSGNRLLSDISVDLYNGKLSFTSPVIDFSALKKEYDRCYGKLYDSRGNLVITVGEEDEIPEGEDYLTESQLKKSSSALTAAKKVLDTESATQSDVDKALEKLKKDFISPKEAEVDFSALSDRIELAQEKVDSSDFSSYSGDYQNKWRSALRKAKSVYSQRGKSIHSQNEVDEAERAIVSLVSTGEGLGVYYLLVGLLVSTPLLIPLLKKRMATGD